MEKQLLKELKKGENGFGILVESDGYISSSVGGNKTICESITNNGEWHVPHPFILEAVFQKYDTVNANGRIYPRDILMKQVEAYQERIRDNRAYGEQNHPEQTVIDLGRLSHEVEELHWEGKTLVGKVRIITSEGFRRSGIISCVGDNIANLILSGLKVGLSSRGIGTVETKLGKTYVCDDFELICFDAVSDPSTPNAWICSRGDENEKQQYIENKINDKNDLMLEKINKIENILL
jgi:hypothetical protein